MKSFRYVITTAEAKSFKHKATPAELKHALEVVKARTAAASKTKRAPTPQRKAQ